VVLMARDRLKRLGLVAGLVIAGVLFAGGIAFAASQTIVGQIDDTYTAATYHTDQGEIVPFQSTGNTHNATANQTGPDGKALFRSATIDSGVTGVQGTQYLPAGTYSFFCTVHPTTMQAMLIVDPNGTPQARPSATAKLRTKTISKAVKKGLQVTLTASTQVSGATVTAKLGKATIGKTTATLAAGAQTVKVKLSKSGKSKLSKKSSAKVTVTTDIPFGAPATAKAKLK
jgi:plastocyanin